MTAAALPLTGAELVPIVQNGNNKKTTVFDITEVNVAYGAWSDSTDQSGSVSAGTAMTFNTQDVSDSVTLADNSKITVPNTGTYDLQFSAQFRNTDNFQHEVVVWFKVNESDIPNSATRITVPARKNNNIYGYAVAAWNIFLTMNSSDYVEIFWQPSSLSVTMEHDSAGATYPAIPSVIATIQQVA